MSQKEKIEENPRLLAGDTSIRDTELSHRLLVLCAVMMAIPAFLWGGIYAYFGEYRVAAIAWAFTLISISTLILFRKERGFRLLRESQLFLTLMLPFLVMLELDGFINSSAVIVWSLMSPMGALLFANRKKSTYWFVAFILLLLIGAAINFPATAPEIGLPPELVTILFVMNLSGVSIVAFVLLIYFVSQKEKTFALLAEERQRSENLIRNMLPEAIGERLKQDQQPIADRLDNVTILFADISGFTSYAMNRPPEEVVTLLDKIFSHFDNIVSRQGLEKIKTIGDAYMVCGGLDGDVRTGAIEAAAFALEIMTHVNELSGQSTESLGLRIGINTGSVVAGVIGHSKYSYDIWGDAVNIAARLQQTVQTGDILISETTAQLLGGKFRLEPQGEAELKGHTPVVTYTLLSKSSDV
ncbi:adenylate/guanylate cyclase domain-containing protein [Sneathiella sp.]|uniref:adenylate/guanylate cyclase domain-containing protein n=1 Tax=Sneathiella sp. TaxID=1964365 RepID=UPI0026093327|nr:adenylate/guanylate cyclase domain-containing protein [Sneathiella sp.]MDF2368782.1 adenylate/guanylate cyclase domain-containing protein [Sneathiella sp.]